MPLVGHKIEITHANFGDMVRDDCLLVDKTLLIKDFLTGQKVSLITRPRRFGKTLTLSMLHYFLSAEVAGKPSAGLFNAFTIASVDNGEFMRTHQGQYPVISITFKDLKEPSYKATINRLRGLIQELYREHKPCLLLDKMDDVEKKIFQNFLNGSVDDEQLQTALKFLSEALYKVYGKKVIILIDEYDSPLTAAYTHGYLEAFSDFMRNCLSNVLKDNPYLEKGLMTGILRVSKNQMLSELNNLKTYTLLDDAYSQYFGFTESEVLELIQYIGTAHDLKDIREFYNGYFMCKTLIYNPWSLMNYLDEKILTYYWVLTSNDALLKKILLDSSDETKTKLSQLMQGKSITGNIDINLHYDDLIEEKEAIWTLLLFAGYLTVEKKEPDSLQFRCQLKIPNHEVQEQYVSIFKKYIEKHLGETTYNSFLNSLLKGDVKQFTALLGGYLLDSFSVRDAHSEHVYHALMLGLVASVRSTHWVDSNKESGTGFYDIMLSPKDASHSIGIILEFKYLKITSSKDPNKIRALLETAAENGLKQIHDRNYVTAQKRFRHIPQHLYVSLAFYGKNVISAHQLDDVKTKHQSTPVFNEFVRQEDQEY